jgi:hypothetical protein
MERIPYNYKSQQRIDRIKSCTLDVNGLKKIYRTFGEIQEEAVKAQLIDIENRYKETDLLSDQKLTQEQFEKFKDDVRENYKIHIQIYGTKGEYVAFDSKDIFEEYNLPDDIASISLDNEFFFETTFNKKPIRLVKIFFDFSRPPVFNFTVNPSNPTANNSSIQVLGENSTWVEGTYQKLISTINTNRSHRAWLHKNNIYDLFVWFLILPLTFWNLRKLDLFIAPFLSDQTIILTIAIYLYVFFLILILFRMLFNYTRWLFPYMELKKTGRGGAIFHRIILFTIISGALYSLGSDAIRWLLKHLI